MTNCKTFVYVQIGEIIFQVPSHMDRYNVYIDWGKKKNKM